jgi:2-C-methyl-D-erythritol 4-phosphate cytidylyltransferase
VDTLKEVDRGIIVETVPRTRLWQAQTPQAFRRELLLQAHALAARERLSVSDDANLCERLGIQVRVVRGSTLNLKITTPDDVRLAEAVEPLVFPR